MTTLTDQQCATFAEQGYLLLPAVFNEQELACLRDEADFILELLINSSAYHKRSSSRLDICESALGGHMVRKIQPINDLSLALAQASADERLVGPLRQLMGDEPILMEEKLNGKQALHTTLDTSVFKVKRPTSRFPVHNDWEYYKAQGYPQSILSSAIILDACTADNGPLRVWPGSHHDTRPHESVNGLGLQAKDGTIDLEGGQDLLAPAGSVLIFSSLLMHNSVPNQTPDPRRLMIYSHYPKAANMGHDVRNGPGRLHESPWELAYLRARAEGRYHDTFRSPSRVAAEA